MNTVKSSLKALTRSASLVMCRQKGDRFEVLLLQRQPNISFGSVWVSPGGVCDPQDKIFKSFVDYGAMTALRETLEETGLFIVPKIEQVDVDSLPQSQDELNKFLIKIWSKHQIGQYLLPVLRLLTIQVPIKRFDTYFYILSQQVRIINLKLHRKTSSIGSLDTLDQLVINEESVRYQWACPLEFLQRFFRGETKLAPPQVFILSALSSISSVQQLQLQASKMIVQPILMRQVKGKDVLWMLPADKDFNLEQIMVEEPQSESKTQFVEIYKQKKGSFYNRFTVNASGIQSFQLQSHPYDLMHLIPKSSKL